MAKSTKHAALICVIVSTATLIGIAVGIWKNSAIAVMIGVFPAAVYETYRTEGFNTKLASLGIVLLCIAEFIMQLKGFRLDVTKYLPMLKVFEGGVDIQLAVPLATGVLAFILIKKTAGVYTKWLAVIIIIFSISLFYILDKGIFRNFIDAGIKAGSEKVEQELKN